MEGGATYQRSVWTVSLLLAEMSSGRQRIGLRTNKTTKSESNSVLVVFDFQSVAV